MLALLPIVERELQVAARQPRVWWLRSGAAAGATLLALLVFLSVGRSSVPIHELALGLVVWQGILAWLFCWFAGIFLTADSLSVEKREGTLGLLFLTDLKGHDIVLGKLVASSLLAVYTLLAILPLLGLPLLAGGVTGGEFLRLLLALLTTLVLSLSIGMFSSARSHDSRHSFIIALTLLISLTTAGPVLALFLGAFTRSSQLSTWLMGTTPVGALAMAFDDNYRTPNCAIAFWTATSLNLALAVGALLWASRRLPHVWQEEPPANPRLKPRQKAAATPLAASPTLHASGRDNAPFAWLVGRDRSGRALIFRPILVLLSVWLVFLGTVLIFKDRIGSLLAVLFFLPFFMHGTFKLALASESTRRLQDDHRSGALELLLVTPLPPDAILAGLHQATRRKFLPVLILLIGVNLTLFFVGSVLDLWDLPRQLREWLAIVCLGGIALLLMDARALFWVSLWAALRYPTHNRAVVATLLRVLLPSWLALLTAFLLPTLMGNNLSEPPVRAFLCAWFVFGGIISLALAQWAQSTLVGQFRRFAAGERTRPHPEPPPAATSP